MAINNRAVNVVASPNGVTAKCGGYELKASGMPESMVEFAAALEQFAEWAYQKGLAKSAALYDAKDGVRKQQDAALLASIRRLVGEK